MYTWYTKQMMTYQVCIKRFSAGLLERARHRDQAGYPTLDPREGQLCLCCAFVFFVAEKVFTLQ